MVTLIWIRTKCEQIKQSNLALVAEWVYERLQIQVAESLRTQVRIPLGTCKPGKYDFSEMELPDKNLQKNSGMLWFLKN